MRRHRTFFNRLAPRHFIGVFVLILLVAAGLRFWGLPGIPPGPHYDEAANGILTAEIANGIKQPIFIPSYTGKEVLFFYLAAVAMRLLGVGLLALRLTSALVGLITIATTAWLVYELFADDDPVAALWLAVLTATLVATSFWHVVLSRVGFRAITQPLLQTLTLAALWRGLRQRPLRQRPLRQRPLRQRPELAEGALAEGALAEGRRQGGRRNATSSSHGWLLLAGLFCGLTGYTYLAARAFPIPLAISLVTLLIVDSGHRRQRLFQSILFGMAAIVSFAPLGLYFLRHPDAFTTRMSQVGPGNDWNSALNGILAAFKMLFLQGDPYIRFNLPLRPLFGPIVAFLLVVGLAVSAWRLLRPQGTGGSVALERARELFLLVWTPIMLLPTALAINEITPSNLRAIGLIPLIFIFPARGLWTLLRITTDHESRITNRLPLTATCLLLGVTAFTTARAYFHEYAPRTDLYEASDGDLADIAAYLNRVDLADTSVYVGSIHFRHPTLAFLADAYSKIKWLVGASAVVYPANGEALYLFPRSAMPDTGWLARHFPHVAPIPAITAADGGAAFTGYQLMAPTLSVDQILADFNGVVRLLGYQVERAVSGQWADATVVWQILAPSPYPGLTPFYHLVDPWGSRWGQAEPFQYAAEDWTPGEIVVARVRVPIAPGAPPGDYALRTGLYSQRADARLAVVDTAGRFLGTTVPLTLTVARAETPPVPGALEIRQRMNLETGVGLALLGANLDTSQARPGERVHLTLFWLADQGPRMGDLGVQLALQSTSGEEITLYRGAPVHGTYPTGRWTKGEIVVDRYNPRLPLVAAGAPPGEYALELALATPDGEALFDPIMLGSLTLVATDRSFDLPAIAHAQSVELGGQVTFLGYDIDLTGAQPGGTVQLTLYWRASVEMDTDYTVFTHLLGQDGRIVAQKDNRPAKGSYPTTLWLPGEIITDPYDISLPADLPPGDYAVEIGFYIVENGLRLADPIVLDTSVTIQP
jgi:4-amino-4-deoxy-L-arabinose transferase-like glycosyltransferase